jgi:hypothetical protein
VSGLPETYAVRRLNPFRGVVQVVANPDARALSDDGERWEIQVLAAQPEHTWRSGNRNPPRMRFFRFGVWTRGRGLRRVPVSPVFDLEAMLTAASALAQALGARSETVPFPLADRCELWLLDPQRRPFALLDATLDPVDAVGRRPQRWAAAARSEHRFRSPSLEARGVPPRDGQDPRVHASRLERLVRDTAGQPPRHAWVRRQPDGGGLPCADPARQQTPLRRLAASEFPPLPLTEHWPEPEAAGLVRDYLDWCAPYLLTLPGLDDALRDRLEHAAKGCALAVEGQHRLYPKVVNPELIRALRVEARLRSAATP